MPSSNANMSLHTRNYLLTALSFYTHLSCKCRHDIKHQIYTQINCFNFTTAIHVLHKRFLLMSHGTSFSWASTEPRRCLISSIWLISCLNSVTAGWPSRDAVGFDDGRLCSMSLYNAVHQRDQLTLTSQQPHSLVTSPQSLSDECCSVQYTTE